MIVLRSFKKGDLSRLHEIDQMCFPRGISYSIDELKYFLVNPRCRCWIAEDSGQVMGFVVVELVRRRGRATGHIITIDVDPQARRKGVGMILMKAAEEQMKQDGAILLSLEMAVDNEAARAFYFRLGFSKIGRIPHYYPGNLDAEVLEKEL